MTIDLKLLKGEGVITLVTDCTPEQFREVTGYLRTQCHGFAYYQSPPLDRQDDNIRVSDFPMNVKGIAAQVQELLVPKEGQSKYLLKLRDGPAKEEAQLLLNRFPHLQEIN